MSTIPILVRLQEGAAQPVQTPATEAPAGTDAPQGSGPSPLASWFVPMIVIFAIFYFLMIGPERKQRKKREAMLGTLKKGDKVMTTGGMFATVAGIQDDVVTLQVAEGVRMRFTRQAVQSIVSEEAAAEAAKKG